MENLHYYESNISEELSSSSACCEQSYDGAIYSGAGVVSANVISYEDSFGSFFVHTLDD